MDRQRTRLLAALAALTLAGCSAPAVEAPPAADPASVDTTVRYGDLSFEERQDVGDPAQLRRPASGALYVVMRYQAANVGPTRAPMDAMPRLRLEDRQGRAFYADPEATAVFRSEVNAGVAPDRSGDLNPGVVITQGLVFELGAEAWRAGGWRVTLETADGSVLPVSAPEAQIPAPSN